MTELRRPMDLYLIGAGGHAKVVIATAEAAGYTVRGLFDDDPATHGTTVVGMPVIGAVDDLPAHALAVVAIGSNAVRQRFSEQRPDVVWTALVHPAAHVHHSARIGAGTVVFAGAIVQPDAHIGRHAIVNTGASVDHDGALGDYAHLGPGGRLGGGVRLEEGSFVGLGAQVLPRLTVGAWACVGAGSTVTRDVEAGVTVAGVPARRLAS